MHIPGAMERKKNYQMKFSYFRGQTKVEEAADLFVRAANAFKMAKKWPGK